MAAEVPQIVLLGSVDVAGPGVPGLRSEAARRQKAGAWAPDLLALLAVSNSAWTTSQLVEFVLGPSPGRRTGGRTGGRSAQWHRDADSVRGALRTARSAIRHGLGEDFRHLLRDTPQREAKVELDPVLVERSDMARLLEADRSGDWATVLRMLDARCSDPTPLVGVRDLFSSKEGRTPFGDLAAHHRREIEAVAGRARESARRLEYHKRSQGDIGGAGEIRALVDAAWPQPALRRTGRDLIVVGPRYDEAKEEEIVDGELVDEDVADRDAERRDDVALTLRRRAVARAHPPPASNWLVPGAAPERHKGSSRWRVACLLVAGALAAGGVAVVVGERIGADDQAVASRVSAVEPIVGGAPVTLVRGHFPDRRPLKCRRDQERCVGPPPKQAMINAYRGASTEPSDQRDFLTVSVRHSGGGKAGHSEVQPGDIVAISAMISVAGRRATDVRGAFAVPSTPGTDVRVLGAIGGSNTTPRIILDEARLHATEPVSLVPLPNRSRLNLATNRCGTNGACLTAASARVSPTEPLVWVTDRFDVEKALRRSPQVVGLRSGKTSVTASVPADPPNPSQIWVEALVVPASQGRAAPQPGAPWPPRRTWRCSYRQGGELTCPHVIEPRLNSVIGAGQPWDERRFASASVDLAIDGRTPTEASQAVFVKRGDVVAVTLTAHNGATSPAVVMSGARAQFAFTNTADAKTVLGVASISTDNSVPGIVTSGIGFYATSPIRLRYLPGSAVWQPGDQRPSAEVQQVLGPEILRDPRRLAGQGALISTSPFALNGRLQGGASAKGTLTLRFQVVAPDGSVPPTGSTPTITTRPSSVTGSLPTPGHIVAWRAGDREVSRTSLALPPCNKASVAILVDDNGHGPIRNVRIRAALTATDAGTLVFGRVSSQSANPDHSDASITIRSPAGHTAVYVPGSTKLTDAQGNYVRNLPDGVAGRGVVLGRVDNAMEDRRAVRFDIKAGC